MSWNGIVGAVKLQATSPVYIADAQVFPNVADRSVRGAPGDRQWRRPGRAGHRRRQRAAHPGDAGTPQAAAPNSACSIRTMRRPGTNSIPRCNRCGCASTGPDADDARGRAVRLRAGGRARHRHPRQRPPRVPARDAPRRRFSIDRLSADGRRVLEEDLRDQQGVGHQPCPLPLVHAAGGGVPGGGRSGHLPAAGARHVEPVRARLAHRGDAERGDGTPDPRLRQPPVVPAAQSQQRTVRQSGRTCSTAGSRASAPRIRAGCTPTAPATPNPSCRNSTGIRTTWPCSASGPDRCATRPAGSDATTRPRWMASQVPVVAHEMGQWVAYPDFSIIDKFTGYLRPGNYEIFRDSARRHGVLDRNHDFALASGYWQAGVLQGRDRGRAAHARHERLPAAGPARLPRPGHGPRRHPRHVLGDQGLCDAGSVPPLQRRDRAAGAPDPHRPDDARHVRRPRRDRALRRRSRWPARGRGGASRTTAGSAVAQGRFAALDIPIGKNIPLGRVATDLARLPAPAHYRLVVGLDGTDVANDWNFWLYPDAVPTPRSRPACSSRMRGPRPRPVWRRAAPCCTCRARPTWTGPRRRWPTCPCSGTG